MVESNQAREKVRVKKLNERKINERIVCPKKNKRESEAIWTGFILSMRMCIVVRGVHGLCVVAVAFVWGPFLLCFHCAFSV